ncbi:molybdate ABC transporter permease subunit, partial [Dysosmobacter welbionis]
RLGREGIDGDDGVRVDVLDDGYIGGKGQGLDAPAENTDAAALADAGGDGQGVIAQRPSVGGDLFCHRDSFLPAAERRAQVVVHGQIIPQEATRDKPGSGLAFFPAGDILLRDEMCRDGTGEQEDGYGSLFHSGGRYHPFGRGGHCQRGQSHAAGRRRGGRGHPRGGGAGAAGGVPDAGGLRAGAGQADGGLPPAGPVCNPHAGSRLAGRGAGGGGPAGLLLPQLPAF